VRSPGSPSMNRAQIAPRALVLAACLIALSRLALRAESAPPWLTGLVLTNASQTATWTPYPAASAYQILSATNVGGPFLPDSSGVVSGFSWTGTNASPAAFYRLMAARLPSNGLWGFNLLNRIEYGPTPDELDRVVTGSNAMGPAALLNEQLNPAAIVEDLSFHTNLAFIQAKLPEFTTPINPPFVTNLSYATNSGIITTNRVITTNSFATLSDLRVWHLLRGVGAKRQLLEILLQFWENHFATEWSKSQAYLEYALDSTTAGWVAAQFEYLENERWRKALLNPQCTFYDLLRVSAESPAMIIYLDTVLSRGQGGQVANENYARELMELFTLGVNNGYDQNDVTVMSRCWAGWNVHKVAVADAYNPFAAKVPNETTNSGVWALNFVSTYHNNNAKTNWAGKTVPARFGAPWAGLPYQLYIPPRSGANGMQDGYDVMSAIANLPFTEEFISVKLCRLLVHDNFAVGYDFTDPGLSPEGQLVRDCMLTWENASPKGQIWPILSNILNSALFRGDGASMQKVKTPLEYTISAIRALRVSTNGSFLPGTFTADTDGYSISGVSDSSADPFHRMGSMLLFNREFPDGYPEDAAGWISAGTLAERVRWIQTYLLPATDPNKTDGIAGGNKSVSYPVLLLQHRLSQWIPSGNLSNPGDVTDFFLQLLFPGEGKANLDLYRSAGIAFLNDGAADPVPNHNPFNALSVSASASSSYDTRVRGLVSLLMSGPRFQEQ